MKTPILRGMRDIADNYDGYVVDLWGVVHDGIAVFPGVIETLEKLRAAAKKLVFLSNAPRRAEVVASQLSSLGITAKLHHGVMSSGEATWQHLRDQPDNWYRDLGQKCLHIAPSRDSRALEGLNFDIVESVESAEFILVTGPGDSMTSAKPYDEMLAIALERNLPMVCANPDREVIRGGVRQICAGAIAERYEAQGGNVRWHGKPDPSIYEQCFEMLGIDDRSRILGIGDSFATDIKGANAAGLDGLLVARGIHGEDLMGTNGILEGHRIAACAETEGVTIIGAIGEFVW